MTEVLSLTSGVESTTWIMRMVAAGLAWSQPDWQHGQRCVPLVINFDRPRKYVTVFGTRDLSACSSAVKLAVDQGFYWTSLLSSKRRERGGIEGVRHTVVGTRLEDGYCSMCAYRNGKITLNPVLMSMVLQVRAYVAEMLSPQLCRCSCLRCMVC